MTFLAHHARARAAAACTVALLCLWQWDAVADAGALNHSAVGIALFAALALALFRALGRADRRRNAISYGLGLLLAAFLVAGRRLSVSGGFTAATFGDWLGVLAALGGYGAALGGMLTLLYGWMARPRPTRGRDLLGRFPAVFGLLAVCWIPAWLALWPGTLRYDAPTQLYTYLDWQLTAHHPLLHTLLLGWCMDVGMSYGGAGHGLALYCGLQLALMALMLAWACRWMARHGAPFGARLGVVILFALLPLYPLFGISATKDVLFGGLFMLTVLQIYDLAREPSALQSPWRILGFGLTGVLMCLMRNNGFYALALAAPFVALMTVRGRRLRALFLCWVTAGASLLANAGLMAALDAQPGDAVETLSIPLQQMARVSAMDGLSEEEAALLGEIYPVDPGLAYDPQIADPVKWAMTYDAFYADPARYLALWLRMGLEHPARYLEAFLVQNLPYFYPGAPMRYNVVLGVESTEMYPLASQPLLPGLTALYQRYDETLEAYGLSGTYLLSDPAAQVWLCLAALGFALWRRRRGLAAACALLLALWVTCLLGPVAILRYMLGFFYAMPVLAAVSLAPDS